MKSTKKTSPSYYWHDALEAINPFIFKISTPNGSGTGFQIFHSTKMPLCGVATAYHVLSHEYEWEEPIKIIHHSSKSSILLKSDKRAIIVYPKQDLAFILFDKKNLSIDINAPKLVPSGKHLKPGVELGWCGFPSIAPNDLCFFSGYVSCYLSKEKSYLVDGVAINGVSGGPAFYISSISNEYIIGGVISAYLPNRIIGQTLPGVCFVSSVEEYQSTLVKLKSLDDAKQTAKKQKVKTENENINIDNTPKKP
jgi:hypothetical protein